ncbi:MAG: aldehyde dehydrogenase (NADP(+)) [Ginsengibacter sp.]
MPEKFKDASPDEIDKAMQVAARASEEFKKFSLEQRAGFMKAIAGNLENAGEQLISMAMKETHLPQARLQSEKMRTVFQLNNYAEACAKGDWMQVSMDTADQNRTPPKPDIRKMMVPLGPVVVFGSSNFPFAYSTAGGDTACAFAAGCPVIVKAHPAHAGTSQMVAELIMEAVQTCNMPGGIFTHIHGAGIETGKQLVLHPHTKAVGFTGSFAGGKQLFDWGNQRKVPIPVFSEMGSVNPVFLLPGKLKNSAAEVAAMYATSITLGVGQFCTNPGLIIGIGGEELDKFIAALGQKIKEVAPAVMLHPGIASAFNKNKERALGQKGVHVAAVSDVQAKENEGWPTIAFTSAQVFLANPLLHEEVFGPYSLVIKCNSNEELLDVTKALQGQLTATVMASVEDIHAHRSLIEAIKNICGRLLYNGVPTGVEVCLSMQHGGPFPATTDSRFTSVGADGIKRFARPLAFQGWPNELLPDELKDENPLKIWRTINSKITPPGL